MFYRREYFFMEEKVQTALIEQQKKITVTGVESVDSFSPQQITITLEGGRAQISGILDRNRGFDRSRQAFMGMPPR